MKKKIVFDPKYVRKAWRNPKAVAAYRGVSTFAKARKLKDLKKLAVELSKIEAYSLHKRANKKFDRRPIILKQPLDLIQGDLIDMQKFKGSNLYYSYIFIAIDCYSKLAFATPIKSKSSEEMVRAFELMFKFYKRKIQSFQSDNGLEYKNKLVKSLLKSKGVVQYSSFSNLKAQTAERFVRTLKELLWKYFTDQKTTDWVTVLPDFLDSYNNSVHSAHKFAPAKITKANWDEVMVNLYGKFAKRKQKKAKFRVGDIVRISVKRIVFAKLYESQYSEELFRIRDVHTTFPTHSYLLEDLEGNILDGSFVEGDLSLAAVPEEEENA